VRDFLSATDVGRPIRLRKTRERSVGIRAQGAEGGEEGGGGGAEVEEEQPLFLPTPSFMASAGEC